MTDWPLGYHTYRGVLYRIAAWWAAADVFARPSLQRRDIVACDKACQNAWTRRDLAALTAALAQWEQAITGGGR